MEDAITHGKKLFAKYHFKYAEEPFTSDGNTILLRGFNDKRNFYITFLLNQDQYLAYDISSDFLPRELYSDEIKGQFTAAQRSAEILDTVEKLLSRTLRFHPTPAFWNKGRGYIMLPIDGQVTKIRQTRNFFDLPTSD